MNERWCHRGSRHQMIHLNFKDQQRKKMLFYWVWRCKVGWRRDLYLCWSSVSFCLSGDYCISVNVRQNRFLTNKSLIPPPEIRFLTTIGEHFFLRLWLLSHHSGVRSIPLRSARLSLRAGCLTFLVFQERRTRDGRDRRDRWDGGDSRDRREHGAGPGPAHTRAQKKSEISCL